MSASLQVSLCIGILQTRFDAFDEVELKLKSGVTVKGMILPMDNTRCFELNTEKGVITIYPEEIEDYVVQ